MSSNKKLVKINIYGGPSCGKSIVAGRIFSKLKELGLEGQYVQEAAKDKVYDGIDMKILDEDERLMLLGEQLRREKRLYEKVDFLVTDSPLFLTAYYHPYSYAQGIVARHYKKNKDNGVKEYHFWMQRDQKIEFQKDGRSHNEDESKKIDLDMKDFLASCGLSLIELDGDLKTRIKTILNIIKTDLKF